MNTSRARPYRSKSLGRLGWLDHGFGTRASGNWVDGRPAATLLQIHSATVVEATTRGGKLGPGDALVTRRPGLWVAVRTADCYPVIIADPVQRALGVVHAGWRGAAAELVGRTIAFLGAHYGSRASDLIVAIGPGIGGCCYQVGPEVASRLSRWTGEGSGVSTVSLDAVLVRQLVEAGVGEARIDTAGMCTFCRPDAFHSFRRDGAAAGRMISAAAVLG